MYLVRHLVANVGDDGTIFVTTHLFSTQVKRLSELPQVQNVSYTQVPVDPKAIFEGVITGVGSIFVPGLTEASNGSEALATFQQCFDPRKLYESFHVKDFFKVCVFFKYAFGKSQKFTFYQRAIVPNFNHV